jgi:hypothetical protein
MAGEIGVRERGDRLSGELHDTAGVIEEAFALLRQLRLPAVAQEDRLSEPLFQPLHLHGHGRLRLVNDIGGLREGAGVGNGDECFQLIDIEKRAHGLKAPYQRS